MPALQKNARSRLRFRSTAPPDYHRTRTRPLHPKILPFGFSSCPGSRQTRLPNRKRALKRASKRALKVFALVANCWCPSRFVRFIQSPESDNLLTSAAFREVTAAEWFRRVSEQLPSLGDSDPRLLRPTTPHRGVSLLHVARYPSIRPGVSSRLVRLAALSARIPTSYWSAECAAEILKMSGLARKQVICRNSLVYGRRRHQIQKRRHGSDG